jgi:hypothetical protein
MSESSPTRHAAPSQYRSTGQASFVLGICGLTLGGCWVILVVLLPEVVDLIGPLQEWPYGVAGAVGVLCGILAIILGAVGWHGTRKHALKTAVPMAGCILGIVTLVLGVALTALDVLNLAMR